MPALAGGCLCGAIRYAIRGGSDGLVSFSIATLSDPTAVAPRVHMCVADELPWFAIADELPRFPGSTLPHPDKRG